MSDSRLYSRSLRLALACAAFAAIGAQAAQAPASGGTMAVMRAALERNPQFEILASDAQAQVFTVRNKSTGEVQVFRLDELAAAPIAQLERGGAPSAQRPAASASASDQATNASGASGGQTPNYTIERSGGQVRVSGPGVSIVSADADASQGGDGARRASEPLICEGRRMLHLDNRDIYVEGDAITVREGCELFITNSRIVATGVGVTVRNAAAHISNSHIEGGAASFIAGEDARLFVRGSTFEGVSQRDEFATVQDQGGNRFR